jgi:hypothetical protein
MGFREWRKRSVHLASPKSTTIYLDSEAVVLMPARRGVFGYEFSECEAEGELMVTIEQH